MATFTTRRCCWPGRYGLRTIPRTSSAGPPTASDLNRKATEHGVAAIWQDARESLDYSVRTYYTKAGHHVPAVDDHPARWRACPRVALRNDRRGRGNPDHVLSRRPSTWATRSSRRSGMRFDSRARSPRTRLGRGRRVSGIAGGKEGGDEGGDGKCGRGGCPELQLVGIGTGGG